MSNLNLNFHENHEIKTLTEVKTAPSSANGAEILIEQLYKFYAEVKVLEDLDLQIKAGEFVAIVGRSGCGKSTLLRLIAQLEKPSYGEIKFQSARNFREGISSADIRVMFQDPRLLPWKSVLANVQLGLSKHQHTLARTLLEKVGLKDKASQWPAQLSGGQRQRVALARALSHSPRILLLDEPLGALDALTRLEMQNLIEQLWKEQGFTAVLVTHDVSEAVQLADRIILLDQGHIAQDFKVNLPRPRKKSIAFAQLEQQVLDAVLAS
ncbi:MULTISPECIES: ATP-binding cassette domain-containing protein [Acinetobacter]|uniref:ATP-binding cassette domain-containing protein n=1 Tax=Acinetobacter haemolyticus TaxID=29430 RepID=A0AAJ3D889_ACIHA|nr:ATP-binding cassette domain-containing protein [Acinetobacter haemolyticus]APR71797.1 aliphatic sulfonate ABC transporter ATP-binding protein [Acinetobacter haemolyticus]MQZ32223.1 ATP-binding cassette domain-containing protein [Acinetobacter haemolyticus]NAR50036.1 ATP-binding cassette domain-containing protein [Acinetobacter haemolyticus]NAR69280.1 ATP-binding cassette domain-containing protein [Acinetobacter haemolyticus]NAR73030.1 ATP-binding cassette domain-containing protein [Acinetob